MKVQQYRHNEACDFVTFPLRTRKQTTTKKDKQGRRETYKLRNTGKQKTIKLALRKQPRAQLANKQTHKQTHETDKQTDIHIIAQRNTTTSIREANKHNNTNQH